MLNPVLLLLLVEIVSSASAPFRIGRRHGSLANRRWYLRGFWTIL